MKNGRCAVDLQTAEKFQKQKKTGKIPKKAQRSQRPRGLITRVNISLSNKCLDGLSTGRRLWCALWPPTSWSNSHKAVRQDEFFLERKRPRRATCSDVPVATFNWNTRIPQMTVIFQWKRFPPEKCPQSSTIWAIKAAKIFKWGHKIHGV